jgi:predicted esterase
MTSIMDNADFDRFQGEMFQLYQQGQYAQALDLTLLEYERFPDQKHLTYFWRVCLLAVTGHTTEALQTLAEALDAGLWFSETQLRQDPDVKSLQGQPEFERLAAISLERAAEAQAKARPELVILEPAERTTSCPLLIALHGNNSNAQAMVSSWQPLVSQGWLVALPQSSQVGGIDSYVWNDQARAEREIREHDAALRGRYAIDRAKTLIAGFSMGASTAIWLVLSGAVEARGFIAVGPGGPFMTQPDLWKPLAESSPGRNRRGYIIVGDQDIWSFEGSQALVKSLSDSGVPCELEIHAGLGHAFPPDFQKSLERALKFLL